MKLNKADGNNGSFVTPTSDSGVVLATLNPGGTLEFGDAFTPVLSQEIEITLTALTANVDVNFLYIGLQ